MNLSQTLDLYFGGPGSGCNPEAGKCGRPKSNMGVKRDDMPQLTGFPREGSEAAELPRTSRGTVNGKQAFKNYVSSLGISIKNESLPAKALKPTQREIDPIKVRELVDSGNDLTSEPIFVSRDNYILDNHHRWAAAIAKAGTSVLRVRVSKIDTPMSKLLPIANKWAKEFGIQKKKAFAV